VLILTLNCGGSSVKFRLIEMPEERDVSRGQVSGLGTGETTYSCHDANGTSREKTVALHNHADALEHVLKEIPDELLERIEAVGHRCVHDGSKYDKAVLIDDDVTRTIRDCFELAPLHNPNNLAGIEACEKSLPGVPQVAVFDSTYNRDLKPAAYLYGLPYRYYTEYGVRRYGFHGITFSYMTRRASEILGRPLSELKLVSLMLGSGTTANATLYGHSFDISTGFTPTEGLLQSTRCGDMDPLAVTYLMRKLSLSPTEMERILNHESGWLGISGLSSDFSIIEQAAENGHEQAQMAQDVFVHRAKKYVGAYAAVLGGIDALLFSGGIGEKSPAARQRICKGLEFLGLHLDPKINENLEGEGIVSTSSSPAAIIVVSTDEEKVIAKETYNICSPAGR